MSRSEWVLVFVALLMAAGAGWLAYNALTQALEGLR